MHFLYVRVVNTRELPAMDVTRSIDPFVEVKVGNYKGITKHFEKKVKSRVELGICLFKGSNAIFCSRSCD